MDLGNEMVTISRDKTNVSFGERIVRIVKKVVTIIRDWCRAAKEYDNGPPIEF